MKHALVLFSLMAAPAWAVNINIDASDIEPRCDMNLTAGVKLERQSVRVTPRTGPVWVLQNGELRHGETAIALSRDEKAAVQRYETELRKLVPQVAEVTHEGMAVGKQVVITTFAALLGPQDKSVEKIERKFTALEEKIRTRVTSTELPADSFDDDGDLDLIGNGTSLGMSIAGASMEFVGDVIKAVFDEDYAREMEARAEKVEEQIEAELDARGDKLEAKAEAMCETLAALDAMETVFAEASHDLRKLNIVRGQ